MNKFLIYFLASASLLSAPVFAMEPKSAELDIPITPPKALKKPTKLELEQLRSPSCEQTNWSYYDFSGQEFEGIEKSNYNFTGCDFRNTNISSSEFNNCGFAGACFTESEMYLVFFRASNLMASNFDKASTSSQ